MANVTYLLGAGASCHCLPTYKNFAKRFEFFLADLRNTGQNVIKDDSDQTSLNEIIAIGNNIKTEFLFHSTPDTIAKKYFHLKNNGKNCLDQLKTILILFFIYEQNIDPETVACYKNALSTSQPNSDFVKYQIDKRYDSFLASILEPTYSKVNIRPEFNILTWNYDLQLEICFQNYVGKGFSEAHHDLQSFPSIKTTDNQEFLYEEDRFCITHLNGIAFSQIQNTIPFGNNYCLEDVIKKVVQHYNTLSNTTSVYDYKQLLNFAWERDSSFKADKTLLNQTIDAATKIASKTEVLVIIGYSFPIFNREVDVELFQQMKKIKKIYIQSPDAKNIQEMLPQIFSSANSRINGNIIEHISTLDYFHIPYEWNSPLRDPFHHPHSISI